MNYKLHIFDQRSNETYYSKLFETKYELNKEVGFLFNTYKNNVWSVNGELIVKPKTRKEILCKKQLNT